MLIIQQVTTKPTKIQSFLMQTIHCKMFNQNTYQECS
jgi:hypothetical protein